MTATSAVCLLALTVGVVPAAFAAGPAGSPGSDEALSAEARKHYEEGTKAFNLAEFPRAIAEFKAAYNAKPDPLLLYNIAQAFRLGGDEAQALFFYKSFLRNMPDAPNRKDVEARIRTLDKAVAEQQKQAEQQKRDAAAAAASSQASAPAQTATTPPALSAATAQPPAGRAPTAPTGSRTTAAATSATIPAPITPLPGAAESGPGGAPPSGPDLGGSSPPSANGSAAGPLVPPLATGNRAAPVASSESVPPPNLALTPAASDGRQNAGSTPIYRKVWFWATVGAVVLVAIVAAGNADKQPSTPLGLYAPVFK